MYSIVENEYQTKSGGWIIQLQFWSVDLSKVDFKTDWRFCELKNKQKNKQNEILRKQSKLLGTKDNIDFPVKYPLILDNGKILEGYEFIPYNE